MIELTHEETRKAVSNLRSRLLGAAMENKDWYLAVDALEFSLEKHDGMMRKDGITPYVLHPVQVTRYLLTLPTLSSRIATIAVGLMHDTMEDCSVRHQELVDRFSLEIADGVEVMSKKYDGTVKSEDRYFSDLGKSPIGSIAKPGDRVNNQLTLDVFSPAKALSTVEFTEKWILPMMKSARRRFPVQELAYENAKLVLEIQIRETRRRLQNTSSEGGSGAHRFPQQVAAA